MNVLLIGGGGREHALAWALKRSKRVKKIWCAPGNAGIASVADCVTLDARDHAAVLAFIAEKSVDLTVIGPEQPLVDGLADAIRAARGRVFGPGRQAARLEGSKVFAKEFMKASGIATAPYRAFSGAAEALEFVRSPEWKPSYRVVKADGLAAGKGVAVCADRAEVEAAVENMMVKRAFGAAGDKVVIEEALEGEELSVMALCDGTTISPLTPSQDHKRVDDGDQGPNTGGMGAYAPVTHLSESVWHDVEKKIFHPFLEGLDRERLAYCGVIYFGLMLTRRGPQVLEFNVRFGDPETQVVVPLIGGDLYDLFEATVEERLQPVRVSGRSEAAVCVVMTAQGYPGDYAKGTRIEGADKAGDRDVVVFHAGTARAADGSLVTAGGRVLGVTGMGNDFTSARARAYAAVEKIRFEGAHYRKDIGARALAPLGNLSKIG